MHDKDRLIYPESYNTVLVRISVCIKFFLFYFTGSGDDKDLFSCETDFDSNDFDNKMKNYTSLQEFLTKLHTTTEKTNGTFFALGAGLNASASFSADEEIMKKIQDETELQISLTLELKLDDVKFTVKTIVGNVDKSDFEEEDNVTVCFGESKDCQKLFELTYYEAFEKFQNTNKATVHVNNIEAIAFEIEGDVSPLFVKWLKNEPYSTKLTVDAHAQGNLKIDIELHGNTTSDDIKKLDDDNDIFDGDILNGLTQLKGEICIGVECANFIECSDNLCNHHQEIKSTTKTTTKPINPTKTITTKTSTTTTEITTKSTTTTTIKTTTVKTTTEKPKQDKQHKQHKQDKQHKQHKQDKQDKNKIARGFGYFCAVVIIFVMGGLVFYYYRKRRNGAMSTRSEYAELTATHI